MGVFPDFCTDHRPRCHQYHLLNQYSESLSQLGGHPGEVPTSTAKMDLSRVSLGRIY